MKELDICYSNKAYKATLIMAGSILEAFLLDWLSEKDGINYFVQDYIVTETNARGQIRSEKKDNLCAYIDQIEEIEHPDWMESSEKAHFIRKNRNSVHAKVCIREELEINDELCKKVISYLNDIIKTRLDKREEDLLGWINS